jgi:hypothetical protein
MTSAKFLTILLVISFIIFITASILVSKSFQLLRITTEGDAIGYKQLAINLNNGSFKFTDSGPTAFRMPGYPIFLAFFNILLPSAWWPVIVAQTIVGLGVIFLTFKLGQHLYPGSYVPIASALFVIINPLLILSWISFLPEALAIAMVTLCVFLMFKVPNLEGKDWWLAIPLAMSIYLKPTLVFFVIGMLILLTIRQLTIKKITFGALVRSLMPGILLILLLLPWAIRNLIVMDSFVPLTTSSGSNLYGGNNPRADGGYVSTEPYILPDVDEVESDRIFRQRAINWIEDNPGKFLSLSVVKAARFFWVLSLGTAGFFNVPPIAFIGILIVLLLFYSLAILGMWRTWKSGMRWEAVVMLTVPLTLLIPSLIAFGSSRFALPAFPILSVLAAVSVGFFTSFFPTSELETNLLR